LLARAGCQNAGSRPAASWSAARCWRPTTTCEPSTPPGCSASTRCCPARAPGPGRGHASHRAGPGRAAGSPGRLPVTGRAAADRHRPGHG
jgi:hypothetical protein